LLGCWLSRGARVEDQADFPSSLELPC